MLLKRQKFTKQRYLCVILHFLRTIGIRISIIIRNFTPK